MHKLMPAFADQALAGGARKVPPPPIEPGWPRRRVGHECKLRNTVDHAAELRLALPQQCLGPLLLGNVHLRAHRPLASSLRIPARECGGRGGLAAAGEWFGPAGLCIVAFRSQRAWKRTVLAAWFAPLVLPPGIVLSRGLRRIFEFPHPASRRVRE